MKSFLLSLLFLFVQLIIYAQFNVCPTGSYTRGEVFAHAVDDQIYWASRRDIAGTIVTTDGGNTWTSGSFTDPRNFGVSCIHAFDANTAFLVASTIFKTTDRGTTWTPATGVYTNSSSYPNTIHFFDQNNGVAMGDPVDGYFEIYTTTNAGVNWVRVPSSNIPAPLSGETGMQNFHAYYNNSYWFTTTSARVFSSTDRGYTWTSYQFPQATGIFTVAFRDELHGIADPFLGGPGWNYYRTSDGGSTWTYLSSSPSWLWGYYNIISIPGSPSIYTINSISYVGKERKAMVLFTNDDGMTWHRMDDWGTFFDGDWVDYGQWASVNSGWGSLYNASQGCIYHWAGYTGKHIWRAASSLKYGSLVLGEVGDTIEISIGNYGTLPTTVNGLNLSSANFSVVNPPSLPLTLQPWNAFEVSISFTPQARGLFIDSLVILSDATNYSSLSVSLTGKALQFTPLQSNYIYSAAESLYTFTLANLNAIPIGEFDGLQIDGLTISPSDSVLIGISTNADSSILYKIDPLVGGLLQLVTISVGNIRAIAFSSGGILFAGQKNGSLYTIDIGTGVATQIGNPSGKAYSSFTFSPKNEKLYASVMPAIGSNKDGIYNVDITTGTATLLGNTGDGKVTPSIAFNKDGTLYGLKGTGNEVNKLVSINDSIGVGTEIGTLGKTGLQAIIMSDIVTGIGDKDVSFINSYSLSQNFPNPFNPSTVISYQLPVGNDVTLKVYDILGNEITIIVNEFKPAGKYEVEFSAKGGSTSGGNAYSLPSGVYFYQLKAGEYVDTKKMILLK
jgi:photosystem II stability/assembly factor-like uncharacterized protein